MLRAKPLGGRGSAPRWVRSGSAAVAKRKAMAFFPNPLLADAEGLVAVGGDLGPLRLVEAYGRGIFPWYEEGAPVLWWSPDPRAIFELDKFRVPRRLARTIRSGRFQVTINEAFDDVMRGCADRPEGTWITADTILAYEELHRLGLAHSVEAWQDGVLAGGLYGVAIGGLFAGESMFTAIRDGSKIALAYTVDRLRQRGFTLFDVQMCTEHTSRLGAVEIPRKTYLRRLKEAIARQARFAD